MEDERARRRFYGSKAWRNYRAWHLRQEPLCRRCRDVGTLTAASEVDHIIALAKGGEPLDPTNTQSLCHSCHSDKTRNEDQLGRERRIKGCDISGRPLDPRHPWHGSTSLPAP